MIKFSERTPRKMLYKQYLEYKTSHPEYGMTRYLIMIDISLV